MGQGSQANYTVDSEQLLKVEGGFFFFKEVNILFLIFILLVTSSDILMWDAFACALWNVTPFTKPQQER